MAGYIGIETTPKIYLTNLISNGSLASNTTGWTMSTHYDVTQNTGFINIKANSTASSGVYANSQTFTSVSGSSASTKQILYCQAQVRGKSANSASYPRVYLRRYKNGSSTASYLDLLPYNSSLNSDVWTTVSILAETYDGTDYYSYDRIAFGLGPTTTRYDLMDIKNIAVVNLTTEFGRDSEPTIAWCDENIIFDGTNVYYNDTTAISRATNISKIYIGINGVARNVKRAYIGINGIARRWFGLPDFYALLNWGTTSDALAVSKYGMAAGSVGDTAIFAGGITNALNLATSTMNFNKAVDAYNSSLVHTSLPDVPYQIGHPGVATLNNQMLIMGGINTASNGGALGAQKTTTTVMDYGWYYNAESISTGIFVGKNLSEARGSLRGDTIGNYALFAGGNLACGGTTTASFSSTVDAFSSALVSVTNPSNLRTAASKVASCHSDNYVIFAGGIQSGVDPQGYVSGTSSITGTNIATAYNTNLVRSSPSNLTYADCYPTGVRIGNYLLVATRDTTSNATAGIINVYNGSTLSKLTSLTLSENKNNMMSATVNGCGYFFGGWLTQQGHSSGEFSNVVDGYTPELVHFITSSLSTPRIESCVATTGDYTLLAGGKSSGSTMMSILGDVETYKFAKTPVMSITSGGGTTTSQSYYSAYIKVGDTNYISTGNITVNAGESLTICAKAASGSYTSGNTTYYYNANVVIRVNSTTVATVQYTGSYTSSYYNYSLGTVSEDTAYSVSLVYGYKAHTGGNPDTYYVDIYTVPGMEKQPESTPTPTPTNLITFSVCYYVDDSTSRIFNYMAESGMTWTQLINSSTYNVNNNFIAYSTNYVKLNPSGASESRVIRSTSFSGTQVNKANTIVANTTYYAK